METVQLQCGNCKQVMGLSAEHLGSQVQCPHCGSVVQTPARPTPAPNLEAQQRESIFGGAEPSDDLFGGSPKATVDPPPQSVTPAPPPIFSGQAAAPAEEETAEELRQFQRRPIYDRGVVQMSILIFLVPYSILTTLIIVYLIFFGNQSRGDVLQYLPDPTAKGGPQRVSMQPRHDSPLSASLRTKLKKPITVGKLTVTPEKIRLTAAGDLELFLRARNEADKIKFEPISDYWIRYTPNKAGNEPYTFLELDAPEKTTSPIYGGYLRYQKSFDGKDDHAESYAIGPREQSFMVLQTRETYRTPHIAKIVKSDEKYLWRVQVRRGFVKKNGMDVSATAVIGVEFTPSEIEREKQT